MAISDFSTQDPKTILKIDPNQDLPHIASELYKKNTELAYTNKALSILRKIEDIILSSVTDPVQVAQQVANAVVPELQYKLLSIFLLDKVSNTLFPLAVSQTEPIRIAEEKLNKNLINVKIDVSDTKNLVSEAVRSKTPQVTKDAYDVYIPYFNGEEADMFQNIIESRSIIIYPLVVREEVLGAMMISRTEEVNSISSHDRDLMDRLSQVIGIAIDSALLYEKIQEANKELKELDRLKDEFVSVASHELRTPLTAIKSYLWLALEGKAGPLTEKQKYYLDRSYESADRLSKLVGDMLNVSRIESGRIELERGEMSLPQIIEDVVAEMLPHAEALGVMLSVEKLLPIPSVNADSNKIKEVLINLIGNSVKFTPRGGKIDISCVLDQPNHAVQTVIKDTGRGISQGNISKLFQKFGVLEGTYSGSEQSHGTGLGLYITKSIIELHGGKIWVQSEGEGEGSTFTFTLPLNSQESASPRQSSERNS